MQLKKLYKNQLDNMIAELDNSLLKSSIELTRHEAIIAANMALSNNIIDLETFEYIVDTWIIDEDVVLKLMVLELFNEN